MIQTSYFALYRENRGVNIALFPPKGFKGKSYSKLAPTPNLLKWWKSCEQTPENAGTYKLRYYKEVLDKLDVNKVGKTLEGYTVLCFESKEKFCHRHLVAEWLRAGGFECCEYIKGGKNK